MCGTFFDQPESWCAPFDSANKDSLKLGGMHTLISLRSGRVYVGHIKVNQVRLALRVFHVMFFGLDRSDLRYSKAYHLSLGMCKSSASSVCIKKNIEKPSQAEKTGRPWLPESNHPPV